MRQEIDEQRLFSIQSEMQPAKGETPVQAGRLAKVQAENLALVQAKALAHDQQHSLVQQKNKAKKIFPNTSLGTSLQLQQNVCELTAEKIRVEEMSLIKAHYLKGKEYEEQLLDSQKRAPFGFIYQESSNSNSQLILPKKLRLRKQVALNTGVKSRILRWLNAMSLVLEDGDTEIGSMTLSSTVARHFEISNTGYTENLCGFV